MNVHHNQREISVYCDILDYLNQILHNIAFIFTWTIKISKATVHRNVRVVGQSQTHQLLQAQRVSSYYIDYVCQRALYHLEDGLGMLILILYYLRINGFS